MSVIRQITLVVSGLVVATALPAAAAQIPPPPAPPAVAASLAQASEQVRDAEERARDAQQRAREAQQRAREAQQRAREVQRRERERQAGARAARAEARRGPEFTENFTRTVRLGANGTFDLSNVSGDITITGQGGDEVRIDAVKRVQDRSEADAKALLQAIQIQVSERPGFVEVRTELPRRRNWSGGVDYTVSVPNSANVTVRTVTGDVHVTNVRGELRAEAVSGDVTATQLGRVRLLKTVSGDLQITEVQGDELTASTVSGDVTARNLRVKALELESVSGDLRFTAIETARANLRSISGDIEYAGRLARSGRYELQSHSGDIRLLPADNTGFDVDASTFSGDIRSDFTVRGAQNASASGRPGANRTLRGAVGDASAILTLRSFNGDILIVRR